MTSRGATGSRLVRAAIAFAVALISLDAWAESPRVIAVDAGPLAAELETLIAAELQGVAMVVRAPAMAPMLVRVRRAGQRLEVEIAKDGVRVVARAVPVDRGLVPALRVVALLVAEEAGVRKASETATATVAPIVTAAPSGALAARVRRAVEATRPTQTATVARAMKTPKAVPPIATPPIAVAIAPTPPVETSPPIVEPPPPEATQPREPEPEPEPQPKEPEPAAIAAPTPAEPAAIVEDDARPSAPERSLAAAPAPHRLHFALGATSILWQRPTSMELGATLAAHYRLTPSLTIGVRAIAAGLGCCATNVDSTLTGRPRELAFLAGASLHLADVGPIAVHAEASAGINLATFTGRVEEPAFPSPSPDHTVDSIGPLGRASLVVAPPAAWSSLRPYAALGVHLRFAERLTVKLPEFTNDDTVFIDAGPVMPFLEIGAILDTW